MKKQPVYKEKKDYKEYKKVWLLERNEGWLKTSALMIRECSHKGVCMCARPSTHSLCW